tara:strand:- start:892 stop:1662 length:771 start_codon:yes stop_codon:yes gene_type:complete
MATLTYDASEAPEGGELTAEEQDSLEVGERIAEQQEQLLAGKYKDAEALEKAYIELQSKFSNGERKEAPAKEEATKEEPQQQEVNFFDALWEESQSDKKEFSESIQNKLEDMSKTDLADAYLDARSKQNQKPKGDITQADIDSVKEMVGGEKTYKTMVEWAQKSFNKEEVSMFDRVIESGDRASIFFAVQALQARYASSEGVEGKLLTGRSPRPESKDVFKSQAAVVRAMKDAKYDSDPAYRQEVMEKLSRSNIDF